MLTLLLSVNGPSPSGSGSVKVSIRLDSLECIVYRAAAWEWVWDWFWSGRWSGKCIPIEFFLNEFHWIQRIQWIMTKSKSGMVTKVIVHLLTDTLPVLVIKSAFSLLPLDRYLLPVTTQNRYRPTVSSGNFFFTTTSRNVTIVRCRMSLVTMLLLDFVMIHWIHWKSFRKNSIETLPLTLMLKPDAPLDAQCGTGRERLISTRLIQSFT